MLTLVLAVAAGGTLGYFLERGDFCFHSTLVGLFSRPRELDLFRAYLVVLLLSAPLVALLMATGSIAPWIAPFAWQANLFGGIAFGVGMVIAATCVTGLFYKLGHGMLGTIAGLAAWAFGDWLAYAGPLNVLREQLNQHVISVDSQAATLVNIWGPIGTVLLLILGVLALVFLLRSPREPRGKLWSWLPLGLAIGLVIPIAWLLADIGGSNYPYGTSGVPTRLLQTIGQGGTVSQAWIPVSLISLVPGAFLAARTSGTFWARGEALNRYLQLVVGGLIMGVAAGIAGGCNLGHSLVGVPLLSLGSITTTLAMGIGVFIARQVRKIVAR